MKGSLTAHSKKSSSRSSRIDGANGRNFSRSWEKELISQERIDLLNKSLGPVLAEKRHQPLEQATVVVEPRRFGGAGRDLTEQPGVLEGASPDHDAVGAGELDHAAGARRTPYVAISHDGNRDRLLHVVDDGPRGFSPVVLARAARRDGDRGGSRRLEHPRELGGVDGAGVPSRSDLDRHRDFRPLIFSITAPASTSSFINAAPEPVRVTLGTGCWLSRFNVIDSPRPLGVGARGTA